MKKVIFSISTLILSGALTACTNHSASEVANQTDTVVTTTSVVSNETTQPSENTVTTSITNDNLTTQLLHNEIPPFLKGASRDEIIQSKGNLKYRTDREGELLVYDNVGYIGTDDIDTLAYAPMLCYFFRDNQLVKEQYYLNAETSTVDGLKDYHSILRSISNIYGAPFSNESMSVDELAKQTDIDNLEGDAAYVTIWQYNNSFLMLNLFYQEGMTTIA